MKIFVVLLITVVALASTACEDDETGDVSTNVDGVEIVRTFLERLENEDPQLLEMFVEDPIITLPMNRDATQNPIIYDGATPVQGYFNQIFSLFSEIQFTDIRITPTEDGTIVFVQAQGRFTVEETGTPYNNVYVFRINLNESGRIVSSEEYLNWVVNGEFSDQPLGSCQERICN